MPEEKIHEAIDGMELSKEELAVLFHNTYERLAPEYGYETRKETKQFNSDTPNGKLMIAVCEQIINIISQPTKKKDNEIERLKGLIYDAFMYTPRLDTHWQQFKTENKL